ncbi:MAG: hypothetical protein ACXW15_04875 [Acidimicrobiia bacterium]
MTYEKPEVRDFGSIAEHTYGVFHFIKDCFPGGSGYQFNGPRRGWDD